MDIGMLWFDNSKNTDLKAKVSRAVEYYRRKYGQAPNLCYVHPSMLAELCENGEGKIKAGNVEVRASQQVLPNHFWVGVDRQVG